jgi:beta-lactamase class A
MIFSPTAGNYIVNFNSEYTIEPGDITGQAHIDFNAAYLNDINSEFATLLLQKCNFKEGIVSRLPNTVKVAHKYGESGNQIEQELNETAIVYLDNNPYVITVMTKGRDYKLLPQVMSEISRIVYQNMVNN